MTLRTILLTSLTVAAVASQATTWDLAADFSLANNPNGPWNYGRYDGAGIFTNNSTAGNFFGFADGWLGDGGSGRPFVGMNDTADAYGSVLGQVVLHPDYSTAASPYAGVQFVIAAEADYHVVGKFYAGDAATVSEYVSYDRTAFVTSSVNEANDFSFDFTQHMVAGEFFDFFIGPNGSGDPSSGTTPLDIHITTESVPEPATFSLLGLGVLAARRRRSRSA